MASATYTPYGFLPYSYYLSAEDSDKIKASPYRLSTAYATALSKGDVVRLSGGYIIQSTAAADLTTAHRGIFAGVKYIDTSGTVQELDYWAPNTQTMAGTVIQANVYDDPFIIYKAMYNSSTGIQFTAQGKNLPLSAGVATAAGSTFGVTANPQVTQYFDTKLVGIVNDEWSTVGPSGQTFSYPDVLVILNNHDVKIATLGVI